MSLCRKKIRRAKGHLEFILVTAIKDHKNNYINKLTIKERLRRISILYWMWGENIVTKNVEKAEVLICLSL